MSKTIIVTGGCGYIGSHIAKAFKLADENNLVYIIDRVRRDHTLHKMQWMQTDDYAADASIALIIAVQPDVIVHCAGTSLVGPSIKDPSTYWDNNVVKTIKLLDAVKNLKKKPIILFSSSASVYGNANYTGAITESQAVNPISPYGNSKATIERMLHDYSVAYGISSVAFRFFNAAGAEPVNFALGQELNATHLIARALESSINETTLTLNGTDLDTHDGTCVRDYVHVWDIASAHLAAVDAKLADGAHVFNLGTGKGISNGEIISYIAKRYGLLTAHGPRREGDPAVLVADASRAASVLAWEPKFSDMETIIDSAYKWYVQ